MIRLDHRDPIPEALRGAILALGNFDGFHQGHQAVVGEAIAWARGEGRPAIVATFDPHPVRYFRPDTAPFRLTTLDQREELFGAAGADAMLVFHFDGEIAGMPAERWVHDMIHGHLHTAGVVTGEDFVFGKGRGGNARSLREFGEPLGIETRRVAAVHDSDGPISSSRIREALKAGDCATARRLLTRPFAIRGSVQHGDKRGREIGFPTANLDLGSYLRPRYGIYAVTGHLPDGRVLPGAASLGVRPMFDPPKELLEPHFLDFSGDLYGQEIEVAFHHFLRPEAKFDTIDALIAQMQRDCDNARKLLSALAQ
ncbi:bifunctional riboflavin kinase/FAD synthetase [Novosphingobium album (ex Liu et al. 2023)]|uniref:Riboflavin biosynthesis protein n=1 Tax=Novosphingobium album (ex Liu et al. 2023) TaxID=3031130 RepID=A0ABT5WQT3_9SPHN|nr:bifunctional riboflavin kinase/FAD synthetase [Novosphingobium album (ex Liu et al. 2023)]MDE8651642.1 bifunctional riboflavin kinase/FAD synthetase [Novosphingobium album (ex Liu et al. 2023)]